MEAQPLRPFANETTRRWGRLLVTAILLVLCLVVCPSIPAGAFGPTGHRVVAKIALSHLTPRTKAVISEILGSQSLIQVSTWADEIRSDPRWRHAAPWHYVSIQDGGLYQEKPMKGPENPRDILQAIAHFRTVLLDKKKPRPKRAEALKWLVHLVADLHQPLHVGRAGDKGGNDIKAEWFGTKTNVHAIWDEGLIESTKLSYTELASFLSAASEEEKEGWRKSGVMDWAMESMKLRDQAYEVPRPDRSGSYAYAFKHLPLVKKRLNQAGVRLAHLLNTLLDDGAPATMSPALHWQRNSAEYRGLARQSYALAAQRLNQLRQKVAAEKAQPWCVVLDADETIFDNTDYFKERSSRGLSEESFVAWCTEGKAGAVPGAPGFLKKVRELGGKIAIVSDRPAQAGVQSGTEANLKRLGLPFDYLLLRQGDQTKEARWQALRSGSKARPPLHLLMFVGDNINDFPGLGQKSAKGTSAEFDKFGDQFILLPNPVYGSWQKNKLR